MSLGSYLKNNRPRGIVLTVIFVLACLVFIVGVVCVISITQMLKSPDLPETTVNQSGILSDVSTVSSSFQGTGENQEQVILTESELEQANANIRSRNSSLGRRPSSSATNTTSQSYTTSRHQTWYDDEEGEEYHTSSRTGSTTSREEEYTSSHTSQPTTSQEEPTTSTPEEPTTSTPEEPTSTPSVPSTSTPSSSTSTPATSTPEEPDLPADGTVTE